MDDKIVFRTGLAGYNNLKSIGKVIHILCEKGGFSYIKTHTGKSYSQLLRIMNARE